ncbi:MAG TPA: histidine kinase [Ohtaekwangia sp.]|nr:histidine kinase [Ohtaekwangia sp.]
MKSTGRIIREVRGVLLVTAVSAVLAWFGVTCHTCRENLESLTTATLVTSTMWIGLWKGNAWLGTYLSKRISWITEPVRRFLVGVVAALVYTVLAVYALNFLYRTVFSINISSTLVISIVITIVISLFMHGRLFLKNWRVTAIEAEELQHESIRARFESLKNQMNPHFLFNSLNALTQLVYEDKEKAQMFIRQLSDVYRYVLETREKELVSLDEELAFARSYLYLQQIRFAEKLSVSVELNGVTGYLPPLALQMLIENAIKHNVISEDQPLSIRIFTENDFLVVENNLQERSHYREPSSGFGLQNIRHRYEALSDRSPAIKKSDGVFRVSIPLLANGQPMEIRKMKV